MEDKAGQIVVVGEEHLKNFIPKKRVEDFDKFLERFKWKKREVMVVDERQWYATYREKVLVKAWLESYNFRYVISVMKKECELELDEKVVKRYLRRPHIRYMIGVLERRKAEANGLTEDEWKSFGVRGMKGLNGKVSESQSLFWKELGKACGYYKEPVNPLMNIENINFLQRDGSR